MVRLILQLIVIAGIGLGAVLAYDEITRPTTSLDSARAYASDGNYIAAVQHYHEAMAEDPGNLWITLELAACHDRNGEPRKALACYEDAAPLLNDPSNSVTLRRHKDRYAALRIGAK
jgi:tetratricopeptide (TPR) repeat protein